MSLMEKLERKWGRYAIPGLHRYFIFAYFLGYVGNFIFPSAMGYMQFSIPLIMYGQVWRLFTWIFCCNSTGIMTIVFLVCLLSMGEVLERFIGTFRLNAFLLGGIVLNIIAAFLVYVISYLTLGIGLPTDLSNYYTLMSMYMAMAICMPEVQVHLYFLIPIKMKWMLVVYIFSILYELYDCYADGAEAGGPIFGVLMLIIYGPQLICTLLNVFLFFHFSKMRVTRTQKKRQKEFQSQFSQPRPGANITRHKCAVCGRTEKDDPNLSFRYCSKCTGNKEYCQDHLFTHTHN